MTKDDERIDRLRRKRWRTEQELKLAEPNSWYARVRRELLKLIDQDIEQLSAKR